MPIDIRHLRSFVVVAEELHFLRAAARLGMEQSPLSRQISQLETSLGVRLFNRNSRNTALSPLGQQFLADARRILTDVETSVSALKQAAAGQGVPLRLGLAEGAAGLHFGLFMRACAAAEPAITVMLVEQPSSDLLALVAKGALEAAIVLDCEPTQTLVCERAWATPMVLAVSPTHPLAKRRSIKLSGLGEERWVLPDPRALPGYAAQVKIVLDRYGITPKRPTYAAHHNSKVRLVAAGVGIALMGASLVHGIDDIVAVPISDPVDELVAWLMRRKDDDSQFMAQIRRLIAQAAVPNL